MMNSIRRLMVVMWIILSAVTLSTISVMAAPFAQVDTSGWVRHSGEGLNLSVPASWLSFDDPVLDSSVLDQASAINPQVYATLAQAQSGGTFALYLIDTKTFGNMNIVWVDLGQVMALEVIEPAFQQQYAASGVEIAATEYLDLPVGRALRLSLRAALPLPDGTQYEIEQFQYVLLNDTVGYIVTMNVGQMTFEDYIPIFEQVAQTFLFGDWVAHTSSVLNFDAPATYLPLDDPALAGTVVDDLAAGNPQVAGTLGQARQGVFAVYLLDPANSANLNLNIIDLGTPMTFQELEGTLRDVYPGMGADISAVEVRGYPVGEVMRLQADVRFPGTGTVMRQFQYIIVDGRMAYIVTMTSGNEPVEGFLDLFEQIANTFVLPGAEPSSDGGTDVSEWITYEGELLSLAIPGTWVDALAFGGGQIDSVMAALLENNPQFEAIIANVDSETFDLFLIDPVTFTNVNHNFLDIGVPVTLEQIDTELRSSYPSMGLNVLDSEVVALPVGEVLRMHLQTPINQPDGTVFTPDQYQYVFMDGTVAIFVTMTVGQFETGDYETLFPQIAQTIQLR